MEALRDLADDFNVRDPRKLYRLARQRDLDVTQAMAFEALKADVGRQVQAPRPRALGKSAAEGPNDRLQADLIDFSQNTRGKTKYGLVVMDVFTREAAVEPLQNKNAETVGRATKRAARELTGDDGNFVVTTDLGNEFATLDRELPENAVHRTKRPEDRNAIAVVDRGIQTLKKDLATRVARKGGQWSDHFERAAGAYNARPHETVHGAPEDVEKQPATEFRVLQDNADKFQHNKDLTERRVKAVEDDERGEELQPSVRRRAAAGGRGLHDRPQHGGPRDPAEAGAAGAAGQRQCGGPADETGQTGGCEAAGRLPGASEAQDPRLAFLDIARAGGELPEPAQALFGAKPHKFPCVPSPCYMSQGKPLNLHWEGGAALGLGSETGWANQSCSPEKLQLVCHALLAAGKRGVHPRLHFGEQIIEAKYACAHRGADKARAEHFFVIIIGAHKFAKLPQFPPDDPEILNM